MLLAVLYTATINTRYYYSLLFVLSAPGIPPRLLLMVLLSCFCCLLCCHPHIQFCPAFDNMTHNEGAGPKICGIWPLEISIISQSAEDKDAKLSDT